MAVDASLLPEALRDFGLRVEESDGWLARGYAEVDWVGQLSHHTGGTGRVGPGTRDFVIRGRVGPNEKHPLEGPLCNALEGINADGTYQVYLIAGRRARHAGPGAPLVLTELLRDEHDDRSAQARGLKDDENAHGNRSLYGREVHHPGGKDDEWTDEMLDGLGRSSAAVAQLFGWHPNRHKGHKHWTSRKTDPSWTGSLPELTASFLEDDVDKETFLAWFNEAMNKGATAPGSHDWADSVDDLTGKVNTIARELHVLGSKVDKILAELAELETRGRPR
jgi:hypothetical protein